MVAKKNKEKKEIIIFLTNDDGPLRTFFFIFTLHLDICVLFYPFVEDRGNNKNIRFFFVLAIDFLEFS